MAKKPLQSLQFEKGLEEDFPSASDLLVEMGRIGETVWSMHPRLRAVSTHLFSLSLRTTGCKLLRLLLWRKL